MGASLRGEIKSALMLLHIAERNFVPDQMFSHILALLLAYRYVQKCLWAY
jgi:hypothetical protein